MLKITIETVTLPAHWASVLINGDCTGTTNNEERTINAWIRDNPHLSIVSCNESAELTQFEGVLTACLEYTAHVNYVRDGHLIYPVHMHEKPLEWQKMGLQYTATGYGAKIPTSKIVYLRNRAHRVYVTQYSNAGTAWIVFDGKRVIVQ
jgi:hypothetical protein